MAKAASQLGITQPSVSEMIADLEHTLARGFSIAARAA